MGPRIAITLSLFTLMLCVVHAQAAGQSAARTDTTQAKPLLDRWRIHPIYTSTFDLVRTSQAWDQSMSLSRKVGRSIDVRNSWSVSNRRDTAQNDLRQKRGQMKVRVDYKMNQLGSWTVGLDGDFRRDSRLSSFRDAIENRSNIGLALTSKLFQDLMRRFEPMSGFLLDTSLNLGRNSEELSNRQATLRDTTEVSGFFRTFEAELKRRTDEFNFIANTTLTSQSGDSKTTQYTADNEFLNLIDDTSESDRSYWNGSLEWTPGERFTSTASGRWIKERNRYYDTQANDRMGGQETKDGLIRETRFSMDWTPADSVFILADFKVGDLTTDFALQERDAEKQTADGSVDVRFFLPKSLGTLAGTELQTIYSGEETSSRQQQTTDFDQRKKRLRFTVRRRLHQKLTAAATEEISLQQYVYVDRSNDRDERRLFFDGSLNYRPSQRFNGIFSVTWNEVQSINIPEAKSANSSTKQTYKVSGDLTYQKGPLTLGQRYTVQADYTFYDFNEDSNSLLRSNIVMTTARARLLTHILVSMKHQYEYKDKGSYVRDRPSDPREYAPTSEEIRHVLTLGATYSLQTPQSNPRKGKVLIDARQLFDRRQRQPVGGRQGTTYDRVEWSIRSSVEKEISAAFKIQVDFTKTESSTEKNYWRGTARIERKF